MSKKDIVCPLGLEFITQRTRGKGSESEKRGERNKGKELQSGGNEFRSMDRMYLREDE